MAGFFGLFNYSKPGKGVDKNAPEKKRFFLFFELLWRKLFKIIQLNIIYFILTLPVMAWLTVSFVNMIGVPPESIATDFLFMIYIYLLALPAPIPQILVILSVILFGPITAGVTYAFRNFARQEHVWIFSDLFEKTKQNFKQGLLAGIIDILVVYSFMLYVCAGNFDSSLMGQYLVLLKYVAVVVFFIYCIMRFYIYTIMVTFELNYFAILRNAGIFVILGIVRNLCTILFCTIVILLCSYIPIITMPFIMYGLTGFITVFNAYPVIDKYMLSRASEAQQGSVDIEYLDGEVQTDEPIFEDDVNHYNKKDDEE